MAEQYTPTSDEDAMLAQALFRTLYDAGVSFNSNDLIPRLTATVRSVTSAALAAHDAQVRAEALRDAAEALDASASHLDPKRPIELSYINCTRMDAQELRHRADRIEGGTSA